MWNIVCLNLLKGGSRISSRGADKNLIWSSVGGGGIVPTEVWNRVKGPGPDCIFVIFVRKRARYRPQPPCSSRPRTNPRLPLNRSANLRHGQPNILHVTSQVSFVSHLRYMWYITCIKRIERSHFELRPASQCTYHWSDNLLVL